MMKPIALSEAGTAKKSSWDAYIYTYIYIIVYTGFIILCEPETNTYLYVTCHVIWPRKWNIQEKSQSTGI